MKTPKKPGEWMDAVNVASVCLHLESARQYGLVTGGPDVDVQRCEELLRKGKKLGYVPRPEAVEDLIKAMARNLAPR